MGSLFVIGNGFDLAHGLKTSYEDFHQYLIDTNPDAPFDEFVMPESSTAPDGGLIYDDDIVVSFLSTIITNAEPKGERWSDLETSIGFLDLDEYFDGWSAGEDDNPYHEVYRNQDLADNLVGAVFKITDYFSDWIDTIEIMDILPKPYFEELIDKENDFFLTFNYTKTLEGLYEAINVCHIHGEQGGELLFGHGNDKDYYDENMSRNVGSEDSLQNMQRRLRKNTADAIRNNQRFFSNISKSVDKIYSYGFSFSDVDKVYIQDICRNMPAANVIWYLNDYDSFAQRKEYEKVIRSCGFNGEFDTYHIS
ncbi:bacteriophage abortive infection AbiH family protein [Paenibacillus sp. sgz302251]|uniref:bacteriophage abortive infection AbiH family protein n=1 Tax=Paenibacillus sp. sgz302251 TaxID=3414493 RepID=UPI003C79811D